MWGSRAPSPWADYESRDEMVSSHNPGGGQSPNKPSRLGLHQGQPSAVDDEHGDISMGSRGFGLQEGHVKNDSIDPSTSGSKVDHAR